MGVQINGDTGNVIATKGTYSGNVTIGGTLTYEDVTNIDAVGLITARSGIEIGARPGVAASISVDGNAIFSGITTVGSKIEVTNDTHGNLNAVLARGADPTFQLQSRNDQHSNSPQAGIGTFGAFYSDNEIIALSFMRGTGAAGAGSLGIIQAGEEKIRINQSGYLGIGTDDPNTELEIQSATDPKIRLQSQEAGNKRLDLYVDGGEAVGTIAADQSSSQLAFRTSGDERVRITSAGQVLVNQSSANTYVDGAGYSQTPLLQVISNDNISTMMSLRYNSGAGAAGRRATFAFARTADGSAVSNNSVLGEVLFMGEGNSTIEKAASVRAEVDGTPGSNDMPGRLIFSTSADGSDSPTERVRIDNAGLVGIGASSTGVRLHVSDTGTDGGIKLVDSSTSSGSPNLEIIAKRSDSNVNTSFTANIYLGKNRTDQKLTDGMRLGSINFGGNHTDGTEDNISYAAAIRGQASGNFDSKSDMPTDLVFTTGVTGTDRTGESASSSNVGTERLRITSDGNIISNGGNTARIAWGTTGGVLYSGFSRYDGAAQDVGISHYATTNAGTTFVEHFRMEHNGTLKGTDTSIGSLSDIRLKKDIKDYSYDISKFKQFKPKSFNWINPEVHGDKSNVKGFIAQDIELVDKDWVEDSWIRNDDPDYDLVKETSTKNGLGEDVGISKISKFGYKDAMYISVIQQLISRIETLESS